MPFDSVTGEKMLDPKVAENARLAWENFVLQVSRMESRMLTAMAEKIDKRWADMVAETPKERRDEPTCCGERQVKECRPTGAKVDETSQPAVGDEWRDLGPEEVRQAGDQFSLRDSNWYPVELMDSYRYRRRATDEALQSLPAETRETTQAADVIAALRPESASLVAIAALREENTSLKAAVERLRRLEGSLGDADEVKRLAQENATLKEEVERLRLSDQERKAIAFFNNAWALEMWKPHGETLRKLLDRLRGGE